MILNLIFDFDGVLIDSAEVQKYALYASYREIVGNDEFPSFAAFMKHSGDSLPNIFTKMGLPQEMVPVYRRISSESIEKIKLNDEAVKLVRDLKHDGKKCAICTGKERKRTIEILRYFNIEHFFDAVVCSDDIREPKPSPESILCAMRLMGEGVNADNTLMIGDGYNDLCSAQAAKCRSVLTLWYGDFGVPRERADYVVYTVFELRELLKKL